MTMLDDDSPDDVARSAVEALGKATRRAKSADRTLVFVSKGQLIRKGASSVEVLRILPARHKVAVGTKKAKP